MPTSTWTLTSGGSDETFATAKMLPETRYRLPRPRPSGISLPPPTSIARRRCNVRRGKSISGRRAISSTEAPSGNRLTISIRVSSSELSIRFGMRSPLVTHTCIIAPLSMFNGAFPEYCAIMVTVQPKSRHFGIKSSAGLHRMVAQTLARTRARAVVGGEYTGALCRASSRRTDGSPGDQGLDRASNHDRRHQLCRRSNGRCTESSTAEMSSSAGPAFRRRDSWVRRAGRGRRTPLRC